MIFLSIIGCALCLIILWLSINDFFKKTPKNFFIFILFGVNLLVLLAGIVLSDFIVSSFEAYYEIYLMVFISFSFLVLFYEVFKSRSKVNKYEEFLNVLEDNDIFFQINKKDRFVYVSNSLLRELNMKKEEVLGEKIYLVFDKALRIKRINDIEANNTIYKEHYKDYSSHVSKNLIEKMELLFANYEGEDVVLNLIERPIFGLFGYKGRISIGQLKSDYTLLRSEKELEETTNALDSIRYKFITTLEIMKENVFFIDIENNSMWANDSLIKTIGLKDNELSVDDFVSLIHKDDLSTFKKAVNATDQENPYYSVSFRLLVGTNYIFVKETAKRIYEDKSTKTILGFIEKIDKKGYPITKQDELDALLNEDELYNDMNRLFDAKKTFELVYISLINIPQINETFGYNVGNMAISGYIKEIKEKFMTESSSIYRLGGLDFAFTICDVRKMEQLKKLLELRDSSLDINLEFGAIKTTINVKAGIALAGADGLTPSELLKNAKFANKLAKKEQFKTNYLFFKDIK